jgi:adenylate cyclase
MRAVLHKVKQQVEDLRSDHNCLGSAGEFSPVGIERKILELISHLAHLIACCPRPGRQVTQWFSQATDKWLIGFAGSQCPWTNNQAKYKHTASWLQSLSPHQLASSVHSISAGHTDMAAERNMRRLCVIMAADIAGYSRLMGADEDGTLAGLTAHRRELIDPLIAGHAGRIVKTTGDGFLAEFASVVDAVRCAVAIQRGMAGRNKTVMQDRRLAFRIGLNLGDVIVQNGDLYGDGVNVAARLEALAEVGGICLSASAHEQVRDKIASVQFEDLGEQRVKNIARPVRAYRVALGLPSPAPAASSSPAIAVLPLNNFSTDPEQEHFADGLAEDLITDLARIDGLQVIARNSTFTYKGRPVNVAQVGRDLGARYVVEGSVRKIDNRVRITAQLIDAATSTHVWADRYDRDLTDIFAVQDEVTRQIVGALRLRLPRTEGALGLG